MALDLAPVLAPLVASTPGWVLAIISVFAGFVVVAVVSFATYMVLGAVKGQRMVGGKMWDADVYQAALQDLHTRKRKGELLDRASLDALNDYQGTGHRRSRRF